MQLVFRPEVLQDGEVLCNDLIVSELLSTLRTIERCLALLLCSLLEAVYAARTKGMATVQNQRLFLLVVEWVQTYLAVVKTL